MKDEHIPPLLGEDTPSGGLGWLVIGVIAAFACVVGVSLVLIAWPLYRSLR
jgi:hypothetical protein